MSREARVGIFVLLGLIILTYFTFRVSKWGLIAEKGYRLTVDFDTAAGLEPKSDVKMAGVPIGKVEEIQLVGNRARLVLRIKPEIAIPIDSVGTIQTQGLLGEKYVEILPGKDVQRTLPAGGRVANTQSPMNLDELVKSWRGSATTSRSSPNRFRKPSGRRRGSRRSRTSFGTSGRPRRPCGRSCRGTKSASTGSCATS